MNIHPELQTKIETTDFSDPQQAKYFQECQYLPFWLEKQVREEIGAPIPEQLPIFLPIRSTLSEGLESFKSEAFRVTDKSSAYWYVQSLQSWFKDLLKPRPKKYARWLAPDCSKETASWEVIFQ